MRLRAGRLLFLALAFVLAGPGGGASAAPADGAGERGEALMDVIVAFNKRPTRSRLITLQRDQGLDVRRQFPVVRAVAAQVPPERLTALAGAPGVRRVELDSPVVPLTESANASFGVTAARQAVPELDGAGITAAVVDSGIDEGHRDLDEGKDGRPCDLPGCVASANP